MNCENIWMFLIPEMPICSSHTTSLTSNCMKAFLPTILSTNFIIFETFIAKS